jgi:hypothetical protein
MLLATLPPITTLFDNIVIPNTFDDNIHVLFCDNFIEPSIG